MSFFGAASSSAAVASAPEVDQKELNDMFLLCRSNQWRKVLSIVQTKPLIALTPMVMDNHITTTVLHQAITSKGNTPMRAKVVMQILTQTPEAARLKNGYGSLPLHVIAQRNTKIDSRTKEKLILELIKVNKDALVQEGGVGRRTPLHIIFTDYISPKLTRILIDNGRDACFMKDRKGYLPAHVACSRHCSPEKLRMLLEVHPGSLHETTLSGDTLLSLATTSATKSHPNYALIDFLNQRLNETAAVKPIVTPTNGNYWPATHMVSSEESDASRERLDSNDSDKSIAHRQYHDMLSTPSFHRQQDNRKRVYSESDAFPTPPNAAVHPAMDPVDLLLHFSRNGSSRGGNPEHPQASFDPDQFAEV